MCLNPVLFSLTLYHCLLETQCKGSPNLQQCHQFIVHLLTSLSTATTKSTWVELGLFLWSLGLYCPPSQLFTVHSCVSECFLSFLWQPSISAKETPSSRSQVFLAGERRDWNGWSFFVTLWASIELLIYSSRTLRQALSLWREKHEEFQR